MGVYIRDSEEPTRSLRASWWQWRPAVEAVRALGLLDGPRLDLLSDGIGELTEAEAREVAAALERRVLPHLQPDGRLLLDGTATTDPDDGTFHRTPDEQHRNYSADSDWLTGFVAFCRGCRGLYVS